MSTAATLILVVVVAIIFLLVIWFKFSKFHGRNAPTNMYEEKQALADEQSHEAESPSGISDFSLEDSEQISDQSQIEKHPDISETGDTEDNVSEATAVSQQPLEEDSEQQFQIDVSTSKLDLLALEEQYEKRRPKAQSMSSRNEVDEAILEERSIDEDISSYDSSLKVESQSQLSLAEKPLDASKSDDQSKSVQDGVIAGEDERTDLDPEVTPLPEAESQDHDSRDSQLAQKRVKQSDQSPFSPEGEIQTPRQAAEETPGVREAEHESALVDKDSEEFEEEPVDLASEVLPLPDAELEEIDSGEGQADTEHVLKDAPRTKQPRKYKGLRRAKADSGPAETSLNSDSDTPSSHSARSRSLPIEIRLRFDHGGFCSVSLIAKRSAELPETLTISTVDEELDLYAMQDEWFQDVVTEKLSRILTEGVVWTSKDNEANSSWNLSGRELFVLAPRSDISGYISNPCLIIGQKHVVLCTERLKAVVEQALRATGSEIGSILDQGFGLPSGWILFQDIVPKQSVAPNDEIDILNALRPLPEIEINFENGLALGRSTWLESFPPQIKAYGVEEGSNKVQIDGNEAHLNDDNSYCATEWDAVGDHTVWCAGKTRSYSIAPFTSSSVWWGAYRFKVELDSEREISICGPLVTFTTEDQDVSLQTVTVPQTNIVILGQNPGDRIVAENVSHLYGSGFIAAPNFKPVWALPLDPLHCNKSTVHTFFLGEDVASSQPTELDIGSFTKTRIEIDRWCQSILGVCRKGIKTSPESEQICGLWLLYRDAARKIWRATR